jgi:D-alanine-D-alanine ligase
MASDEGRPRKIRVAVVFGGRGPEHAVSCMGGGNMLGAIDRSKYEVIPIGITREGSWVIAADEPARLTATGRELPSVEAVAEPGSQVVPWAAPGALAATAPGQIPNLLGEVDVVLPVLHGPFGEDGTIQGLLELAGVPYVGAGVLASAVSMDKEYMKIIFQARGLPVAPHVVVHEQDWRLAGPAGRDGPADPERKRVLDAIAELGWPVFVKPARGGSSIGTSKASDLAQLEEAIRLAREYDPKVIVEAAITGREIECSVLEGLDGGPPDTSMPGQLLVEGGEEFFDFEAKYLDPASRMAIPAPIPAADLEQIRSMAAAAFTAVSCEGFARVDFFYTPSGQILVNEINTIPGLSPASFFQKMWEASGLPFGELVDRLLQTALRKRPGNLRLPASPGQPAGQRCCSFGPKTVVAVSAQKRTLTSWAVPTSSAAAGTRTGAAGGPHPGDGRHWPDWRHCSRGEPGPDGRQCRAGRCSAGWPGQRWRWCCSARRSARCCPVATAGPPASTGTGQPSR